VLKRNRVLVSLATLCCVGFAGAARAVPPPPKDWEIQLKVYAWTPSLTADLEAKGVESTIDADFWDILSDLGWAVMGGAEGRYKRALLMVDFLGMQVAVDGDVDPRERPFTLPDGRVGNLSVGGIDASSRLTEWMVDTKLGFRALSIPFTKLTGSPDDPEDPRRLDFDLLAGFRYWNVTTNIHVGVDPAQLTVGGAPVTLPGILPNFDFGHRLKLPGALLVNGTHRHFEETTDWYDPIVGFRVGARVCKGLTLSLLGDIGGWGVGSDLTWQGLFNIQYDFSEHWGATLAYRAIGLRFSDSPLQSEIMYGPQFGVVYRF
jgi:hypothetical protein